MGFFPNALRIHAFAERPVSQGFEMLSIGHTINFGDSGEGNEWYSHPAGRECDVAVIPLKPELSGGFKIPSLNLTHIASDHDTLIGDDVFVVGYPEGQQFDRNQPLWKRGTIATEPSLDQMGIPQIYVDMIGNKGLSGSPVLGKIGGAERPICRSRENESAFYGFIGIYAGRLGDEGLGSQIGRIYKASALSEILDLIDQ